MWRNRRRISCSRTSCKTGVFGNYDSQVPATGLARWTTAPCFTTHRIRRSLLIDSFRSAQTGPNNTGENFRSDENWKEPDTSSLLRDPSLHPLVMLQTRAAMPVVPDAVPQLARPRDA